MRRETVRGIEVFTSDDGEQVLIIRLRDDSKDSESSITQELIDLGFSEDGEGVWVKVFKLPSETDQSG